jgi:indole-3-glycerol phosphate synthase
MTILEQIVDHKKIEIQHCKELIPISDLEEMASFSRKAFSLKSSLLNPDKTGIIAEFKRRSPSKGIINSGSSVEEVTTGYARSGASALSVLTDHTYFGGSNDDLITARNRNQIPILRKEFTIDEYQIFEAKAIGADAILLIASILTADQCFRFARLSHDLGLEVLLEIHNSSELDHCNEFIDQVGINNRNLNTFHVDLHHSVSLASQIPNEFIKVSESGISSVEDILILREHGFNGFLIGENFMKYSDPVLAFSKFIEPLNRLKKE